MKGSGHYTPSPRDYTFDYAKQCSRALFKYKKAFMRNDGERYTAFIHAASEKKVHFHADNLYPYELVDPYLGHYDFENDNFMRRISEEEKVVLNAQWDSLITRAGRIP